MSDATTIRHLCLPLFCREKGWCSITLLCWKDHPVLASWMARWCRAGLDGIFGLFIFLETTGRILGGLPAYQGYIPKARVFQDVTSWLRQGLPASKSDCCCLMLHAFASSHRLPGLRFLGVRWGCFEGWNHQRWCTRGTYHDNCD